MTFDVQRSAHSFDANHDAILCHNLRIGFVVCVFGASLRRGSASLEVSTHAPHEEPRVKQSKLFRSRGKERDHGACDTRGE